MISSLITQIGRKEIVLPAIQRDFVWKEERISMMFDSIMRGDTILKDALIDRNLLDYRKYRKFYKDREKDILEKIKKNMRLNSYETKFIN